MCTKPRWSISRRAPNRHHCQKPQRPRIADTAAIPANITEAETLITVPNVRPAADQTPTLAASTVRRFSDNSAAIAPQKQPTAAPTTVPTKATGIVRQNAPIRPPSRLHHAARRLPPAFRVNQMPISISAISAVPASAPRTSAVFTPMTSHPKYQANVPPAAAISQLPGNWSTVSSMPDPQARSSRVTAVISAVSSSFFLASVTRYGPTTVLVLPNRLFGASRMLFCPLLGRKDESRRNFGKAPQLPMTHNMRTLEAIPAGGVEADRAANPVIKTLCVCGARPNFMKVAALVRAFDDADGISNHVVHTGQHYDPLMSALFFDELGLPEPDINLGVGSGSHAVQTAEIMQRFEPVLLDLKPDWVVVVGDVNSTIACALTAAKLGVRVAHVEAGLRSFDRSMPEEINRVLTDSISDLLFVSERSGLVNLRREGVPSEKTAFVGNVMIDTLLTHQAKAERASIVEDLDLVPGNYGVITLHRPSNVDDPQTFSAIVAALAHIAHEIPLIFPMHPRTRASLARAGLAQKLEAITDLRVIEPLGYLDFLKLMTDAGLAITDSGGIQEETTILGVPCMTVRPNTERPATILEGTNRLVDPTTVGIVNAYHRLTEDPPQPGQPPEKWDGKAGQRIARCLLNVR